MSGLPRGSLTRELLVRESLRLLDKDGVPGFSLPKLGRALGADPTAIYRHFASKDDLVLAIAEAMIEKGLDGIEPAECWMETLRDIARRARRSCLAHPVRHVTRRLQRQRRQKQHPAARFQLPSLSDSVCRSRICIWSNILFNAV